MRAMKHIVWLLLAAPCVLSIGCGGKEPPPPQVQGKNMDKMMQERMSNQGKGIRGPGGPPGGMRPPGMQGGTGGPPGGMRPPGMPGGQ